MTGQLGLGTSFRSVVATSGATPPGHTHTLTVCVRRVECTLCQLCPSKGATTLPQTLSCLGKVYPIPISPHALGVIMSGPVFKIRSLGSSSYRLSASWVIVKLTLYCTGLV